MQETFKGLLSHYLSKNVSVDIVSGPGKIRIGNFTY